MIFRLGIVLLGGILMGLSPAPLNLWPLAYVALVPLWVAIADPETKKAEKRGEKREKRIFLFPLSSFLFPQYIFGLSWGIGYHGLALFWLTGIHPMTWLGVPWLASLAIAIFCWVFITLWGAALVSIWALVSGWIWQQISQGKNPENLSQEKPPQFPQLIWLTRGLIGTAVWCGLEYLWSIGPLWWSSLSYTQSPHNPIILHLGQLSGPNTITAVIVAVNGFIAEAWILYQKSSEKTAEIKEQREERKEDREKRIFLYPLSSILYPLSSFLAPIAIALSLFIAAHSLGFYLWNRPLIQPAETALKVGIIQGNISNDIKFNSEGWRKALAGYTLGYRELADRGVDAVLIPETALPYLWTTQNQMQSSFYQAILEKGVVAWVGTFGLVNNGQSLVSDYTNSLFTVMGNGQTFSRYDKTHLVPLGEYIPFEKYIGGFIDRLSPLDAHLVAGSPDQIFETPFGRAVAGICFDAPFAEHFRRQAAAGGEFILTASNDAHYHADIMWQHHALEVMRAIETDRWAVRATNTGLSAIVDPHGKTHWHSQINQYDLSEDTIYRRRTKTLYVRWGDRLTPALLILAAIAGFLSLKRG
jgi:apolipoprotein N-acyltransferase